MFTFYCITKTVAKTKTNMFLQTVFPKKSNVCAHPDRVLFYKIR